MAENVGDCTRGFMVLWVFLREKTLSSPIMYIFVIHGQMRGINSGEAIN